MKNKTLMKNSGHKLEEGENKTEFLSLVVYNLCIFKFTTTYQSSTLVYTLGYPGYGHWCCNLAMNATT